MEELGLNSNVKGSSEVGSSKVRTIYTSDIHWIYERE